MDGTDNLYARGAGGALKEALADTPVVCVLGPRQSGKSTLVQMIFPNRPYLTFDDENYLKAAQMDPVGFVEGLPETVTLDEIQRAPALLRAIKSSVDRDRRPGRFLLTGSANLLLLPSVAESLAGRVETIYLHPLSESEKERSPGRLLENLLSCSIEPEIRADHADSEKPLPTRIVEGGYPEPLTRAAPRARQWHRQYIKSIIDRDIKDVAKIKDGDAVARLLELLAVRTACLLNVSELAQELGMRRETIDRYLLTLERLLLIRRLPAWHRHAARRLVKTPKAHIVDSGLASTLAGMSENDWLKRRGDMGRVLESFVVQQIIAQSTWTDQNLRFWHYRDKDKVEVDLVITRGQEVWGVEVKAGSTVNEHDAAGLRRLAGQTGPSFRMGIVLYAGGSTISLGDASLLAVPLSELWET